MRVFRSLADIGRQHYVGRPRAGDASAARAHRPRAASTRTLVVVLRLDEARGRLLAVETWVGGGAARSARTRFRSIGLGAASSRALRLTARSPSDEPLAGGLGLEALPARCSPHRSPSTERRSGSCAATRATAAARRGQPRAPGNDREPPRVALEESRLSATADERTKSVDLIDALRAGDLVGRPLADWLGVDLGSRHAVVLVEALGDTDAPWPAACWSACRTWFPEQSPTSGRARSGRSCRWLSPTGATGSRRPWGSSFLREQSRATRIAVQAPDDYPRAFREARMACAVAHTSSTARRVQSYPALGAQRYLWTISRERDPDPVERAVGRLRRARRGARQPALPDARDLPRPARQRPRDGRGPLRAPQHAAPAPAADRSDHRARPDRSGELVRPHARGSAPPLPGAGPHGLTGCAACTQRQPIVSGRAVPVRPAGRVS